MNNIMANKKIMLLLGVLVFALALLWMAPATLLANAIANKTQQHVLLTQAEGSAWAGNANLVLAGDNVESRVNIGNIRWQVYPMQLLQGRLYLALYQNAGEPAWLSIDADKTHIEHLNITMPASVISLFVPTLNVAQLGGQFNIATENFTISQQVLQGKASVNWRDASSPLSAVSPLGSYQTLLDGNGGALNISLSTMSGALQLEGNGSWSAQTGLQFNGTASAEASKQKELAPLLHVLGNEQTLGSGRYQIQVSQP
ncbi:MAG: type II secretion system protein N [Methylotenera sp.]|nr:type II secretion system protein N [Methylotenera sp.]